MLQTLFRIVINWTCKCLGKLCKIVLNEVIEMISEDVAKKVVSKLLRQDRNFHSRMMSTKKQQKIKQSYSHHNTKNNPA